MQHSFSDISGIVEILNRLYLEIRGMEEPFGLIMGGGDFRPRIDYFHDAVRALTAQDANLPASTGNRLSVEMLAYDAASLRYLQGMPLAALRPQPASRPAKGSVMPENNGLPGDTRPDRAMKMRLGELYQQYGILFVALFKPHADHSYQDRVEALNDEVKQLSGLLHRLQAGQDVQDAISHLDDPALREALLKLLREKRKKDIAQQLKDSAKAADNRIATLDKAHLHYAGAQLAMFEEGKDIVKKLAERGMNLAGRFVESAMAGARRESRRGR